MTGVQTCALPIYFVWAAISGRRTVVIDTGCSAEVARKRGRTYLWQPSEGLRLLGIDPAAVEDVVITHLHYDHAGTTASFPKARFHLQEGELHFATGHAMLDERTRQPFEAADVVNMVQRVYEGRVRLHQGDAHLSPGLSLHLVGGHTPGLQVVRVYTERGWVVLASDACHFYENVESDRPFSITYDADAVIAGFETLRRLADSPRHIIPGHDPLVMQRYPAPSAGLDGIAVRLDVPPTA